MIPRYGDAPVKGVKYRARPGAYAILPREGSLLLTVQIDDEWDLQLPGGGVDPGEHPIPALHREVLEETGWRISSPRHVYSFRRFVFMPEYDLWAEKLCHIYVARPVFQLHDPIEEAHLATWMSVEDAVTRLGNPGDRVALRRWCWG